MPFEWLFAADEIPLANNIIRPNKYNATITLVK